MVLRLIGTTIASVWRYRTSIVCVVTPLALLPLLINVGTTEAKAAFIIILMSFYWNFEVLPLGVTALIPVLLVPLFGILPSNEICPTYFKDSNMLFLGGLIMAVSIEAWGLHRRIALRVLLLFGVQPRWLLFGFLLPTYLLSMWISNTATTAMMLPIAEAVLRELRNHYNPTAASKSEEVNAAYSPSNLDEELGEGAAAETSEKPAIGVSVADESASAAAESKEASLPSEPQKKPIASLPSEPQKKPIASLPSEPSSASLAEVSLHEFIADKSNAEFAAVCKMLMLSIAYGAVFGGVATITGTAPNVIFNGIVQEYFGSETSFNYSGWLFYAMPVSIVCLLLSWMWLQISFLGFKSFKPSKKPVDSKESSINATLRAEYESLGGLTFAEVEVLLLFALTISLWISRDPGSNGWARFFQWPNRKTGKKTSFLSDAQPAIMSAILLFILPSQNPFRHCKTWRCCLSCCSCCKKQHAKSAATVMREETVEVDGVKIRVTEEVPSRLMTWRLVQEKVAWHIVLMLGSGLALAETSKESGLSAWIGNQLSDLGLIPISGLVFIFCFVGSILTEMTSNGAAATILLPILASFSERIRLHPFYLMLPATASCSFAFILPISTPANIMVYSRGFLSPLDMMRTGAMMTIISNSIVAGATLSYAPFIFGLQTYPPWAFGNATVAV